LVTHGVVSVGFGVLTEERVASVVDAFAGERVCVEGADPAGAPADGSQQTSGDGWRLLADEPEVGDVYRTGLATDEASYRALWADIGLTGPRPDVDFDAEIVIWFGAVYGSSCPNLRLDDVVVKRERALVHAEIVLVDRPSACTADATRAPMWWRWIGRPFQRDRSRSSSVPRTHRPARQRNASGSTPTSPSPERLPLRTTSATTQRPAEPETLRSGDTIEPGYPVTFRMDVRCGIEWLGVLNDVSWRTAVPAGSIKHVPVAWREEVADGVFEVEVTIRTGSPPTATAVANGHKVVYQPAAAPPPACKQR
jgi:hypothetical protein